MAKGGKATPWKGVARGVLAALALYLCGTALLALLMVKGAVPERAGFPVLMVLCVASALCGGLLAVPALPPLPAGMAVLGCFAGVLLAVGAGCWQGITWMGRGGVLLLGALAGGLLAGVLAGSRRGRSKKGKRVNHASRFK